ncbi:MAG: flagellar hook-length control protein FliK [Oscillospiraceae bacterium]
MTVSMNTGGGMRSDFMISDAAIPMRMEELDSAKQDFSQYLQGTAEEAKAVEATAEQPIEQPTEQAVTAEDIPAKPIKQSAKELAEISEEAAAELAALIMAYSPAEASPEIAEETTEGAMHAVAEIAETEIPQEPIPQAAEAPEIIPQPEEIPQADTSGEAEKLVTAEVEEPVLQASGEAIPNEEAVQAGEQEQLSPAHAQALKKAADSGELGKAEVTEVRRQPEQQTSFEQSEQQGASEQNAQQESPRQAFGGRIKSASDEVEMLKSAKAKAEPVTARAETPLNAETPIVFTRENGEEVSVRPSEVISQAQTRIIDTAKQMTEDETEYSMVLNPEELGRITVKLTKNAEGAVSVTIAAENSRTQQLLEQNSSLMQDNLRSSGVRLENWQTVSESQQEMHAEDYRGSSKNPYYRDDSDNADNDGDGADFAEIMAAM